MNTLLKLIADEIKEELIREDKIYNLSNNSTVPSWIKFMVSKYPHDDYPVEIFPFFTGRLAEAVLTNDNTPKITKEFASTVWCYLHKQLFDTESPPTLPELCYDHNIPFSTDTFNNITTSEGFNLMPLGEALQQPSGDGN